MDTETIVLLSAKPATLEKVGEAVRAAGRPLTLVAVSDVGELDTFQGAPIGLLIESSSSLERKAALSRGVVGVVLLKEQIVQAEALEDVLGGAVDVVDPHDTAGLISAVQHLATRLSYKRCDAERSNRATLVDVVQRLSTARSLADVMAVVRRAARELTDAQGAAFILREGDMSFYADEDAISPLWRGQRFPMARCIGGAAMLTREPVVVERVLSDQRIPSGMYESTFVRSLVMVPIRTIDPVGAIGTYWAYEKKAPPSEVELLQALANATALALENVTAHDALERRVEERTRALQMANEELDAFAASVSHDLRARLNAVHGFNTLLTIHLSDRLDDTGRSYLDRVKEATTGMTQTIGDLLTLSRSGRQTLALQKVNLSQIAERAASEMRSSEAYPATQVDIAEDLFAYADPGLLRTALDNLLSNAFKYSAKQPCPRVEVGLNKSGSSTAVAEFYVKDNGAGFDSREVDRLFHPFVRLHSEVDFPGTGLGLTIVRRVIERLGGRVRLQSASGQGTTAYFTLPLSIESGVSLSGLPPA